MEFWKFNDPDVMQLLQQEGRELQADLREELHNEGGKEESPKATTTEPVVQRVASCASIGAMVEQSCILVAAAPLVKKAGCMPQLQPRVR